MVRVPAIFSANSRANHLGSSARAPAATGACFRKGQDGWVVLGRQDIASPAQESTSTRGHLLRGDAEIGAFGSGDGYQGLEDNPRAVISHGEVTLVFDGGPRTDLVLDQILRTLEWKVR